MRLSQQSWSNRKVKNEKKENKKQGFENQIDDDDLFKMMLEDLKKGR